MQLREEQRGLSYPDVRLGRGEAEVLHMSEATANSYCPLGSAYLEMDGVLRHGCGGQSSPRTGGKETETLVGQRQPKPTPHPASGKVTCKNF